MDMDQIMQKILFSTSTHLKKIQIYISETGVRSWLRAFVEHFLSIVTKPICDLDDLRRLLILSQSGTWVGPVHRLRSARYRDLPRHQKMQKKVKSQNAKNKIPKCIWNFFKCEIGHRQLSILMKPKNGHF